MKPASVHWSFAFAWSWAAALRQYIARVISEVLIPANAVAMAVSAIGRAAPIFSAKELGDSSVIGRPPGEKPGQSFATPGTGTGTASSEPYRAMTASNAAHLYIQPRVG